MTDDLGIPVKTLYRWRSEFARDGHDPMERFFGTLKTEALHRMRFATRDEARRAIFDDIETFYNRRRRHAASDYMSPAEYELVNAQAA